MIRVPACRASPRCNSHRALTCTSRKPCVRPSIKVASAQSIQPPENAQDPSQDEFIGLTEEEDFEVPGTYFDALSPNTKLGRAVKEAVQELEHLGSLEQEVTAQYNSVLQQFGLNLEAFAGPKPTKPEQGETDDTQPPTET